MTTENENQEVLSEEEVKDSETIVLTQAELIEENEVLKTEITKLNKQINTIKEQQKQLMLATKVNTLKEQEIRNNEFKKYAKQQVIEASILPVLLNFERALNYETDNKDVKNFLVGFKYIFSEMKMSLANEGLTEITEKVGNNFDSKTSEAVETKEIDVETDNEKDNMVYEVVASGYQLFNRMLSPVKVKIIKLKTKI